MVKRRRSHPSNNTEERPADGLHETEMSREALALTPSIGCGTRSRPQSNATPTTATTSTTATITTVTTTSATTPTVPTTSGTVNKVSEGTETASLSSVEGCIKAGPRTSARVSKRVNREAASAAASASQPKKAAKPTTEKCSSDGLKTRRTWELWSTQDMDAFFEALCEYGKDFENIQLYIAQRNKRKSGLPNFTSKNSPSCVLTKNKDQVRHFYYRTWHKICKYLDCPDEVRKPTQELYGLINFGEMRKKLGIVCVTEKYQPKLNELIMHGTTSLKYKGKKIRLKTPVCRALKKLNNIEDSKEPETNLLPKEVCVELRPANNAAFANVQSLSQNPNLRTRVAYSKRLSTLLAYLEKRWKPTRLKHLEQVSNSLGQSCKDPFPEQVLRLRVVSHKKGNSSVLSVAPVESLAWSGDLSLQSHLTRIANKDSCSKRKNKKQGAAGSSATTLSQSDVKVNANGEEAKDGCKEEVKVVPDEESVDAATQAQQSLNLLKTMLNDIDPNSDEEKPDIVCSSPTASVSTTTVTTTATSASTTTPSVTGSTTSVETSASVTDSKADLSDICPCVPVLSHRVPSKLDAYLASETSRASLGSEDTDSQPVKTRLTLGQLLGGMTTPSVAEEDEEMENDHQDEQINSDLTNGTDLEHSPVSTSGLPNEADLEQLQTKGWTLATCHSLTFGDICLMLDLPDKLVLEYDWEDPEPVPEAGPDEKVKNLSNWLSQVLNRLLSVSSTHLTDFKSKQAANVSPVHRAARGSQMSSSNMNSCGSNSSVNSSSSGNNSANPVIVNSATLTPLSSKTGRRVPIRIQRQNNVPLATSNHNIIGKTNLANGFRDTCSGQQQPQIDELDQHVFVVPIGAAPRCASKSISSSLESVKDQLGRLVPGRRTQRGVRHKKPLVVQRPLLPRQGQGSPGSMTLVHLLPSSSARTLVLPSAPTTTVQISTSSAGSASPSSLGFVSPAAVANAGISSKEVPVVVATSPVAVAAAKPTPMGTSLIAESGALVRLTPDSSTPTASPLVATGTLQDPLKGLSTRIMEASTSSVGLHGSPPSIQISIPEPSDSSHLPSILDISLAQTGLSDVSQPAPTSSLLDFADASNSSLPGAFGLTAVSRQHGLTAPLDPMVSARPLLVHTSAAATSSVTSTTVTPPHSPNGRFKVNSPGPESQWLNGEGGEFSLSSLLGTLDSPLKNPSNPSHQGTTNNNSMDSASCLEARLGREVETHLHCLINENSVDYVAKFADLAAQISSTENKCV